MGLRHRRAGADWVSPSHADLGLGTSAATESMTMTSTAPCDQHSRSPGPAAGRAGKMSQLPGAHPELRGRTGGQGCGSGVDEAAHPPRRCASAITGGSAWVSPGTRPVDLDHPPRGPSPPRGRCLGSAPRGMISTCVWAHIPQPTFTVPSIGAFDLAEAVEEARSRSVGKAGPFAALRAAVTVGERLEVHY